MKKIGYVILIICMMLLGSNALAALPVTSGVQIHLDASSITGATDGAGIALWPDLSGAGNDATQATAANQPIYNASNPVFGGNPTVQFDGATSWMDLPDDIVDVTSCTAFAVAQYTALDLGHSQYILAGQDGSGDGRIRFMHEIGSGQYNDFSWRIGNTNWTAMFVDADTEWHVFGLTSAAVAYLDGANVASYSNTAAAGTTADALCIGSYREGNKDYFGGYLAELIIYDHVLTEEEISQVSDYLAEKWSSSTARPSDPNPENGQPNVPLNVTLEWKGSLNPDDQSQLDPNVVAHYVYIDFDNTDSDPNLAYQGQIIVSDWSNPNASWGPLSLSLDDSISWQIKEAMNTGSGYAGDPNNILGPIWSFTAIKSVPVVSQDQPDSIRAFPADGAVFTVDFTSISEPTVKWYYDDNTTVTEVTTGITTTDNGSGSYTTTLEIETPLDSSNEGQYYCSVNNDGENWFDSGVGDLVVKRQLAQYDFDGDLGDGSSNGAPTGTAMDSLGDPNTLTHIAGTIDYVTGADGTENAALYLDPNEYINFGTDGYPKASVATSNGFGGGLDEGTVVVWVQPNADVLQTILANLNDNTPTGTGTTGFMTLLQADQDLDLYVRGASGTVLIDHLAGQSDRPEYNLSDGNWHMMAACWSGGTATLYVDGQWVAEGTGGSPTSYDAWQRGMLLGATRTSASRDVLSDMFAGGAIDNLRIYNYRLDNAGADIFAQEYLDNTGIQPCLNTSFLDGQYNTNLDNTGLSYCKVDLADFAAFATTWLESGLYPLP